MAMSLTSRLLSLAVLPFTLFGACGADAATIDFQSLEVVDTGVYDHGFTYSEDGFTLENLTGGLASQFRSAGTMDPFLYPGSTALWNNAVDGVTRLSQANGNPFDLLSIALSELADPGGAVVTYTGFFAGGGSITQAHTLDGVFGLEAFAFAGFISLDRVEWAGVSPYHQFDDIVVVATPEPRLPVLLTLVLAGVAVRSMSRTHLGDVST